VELCRCRRLHLQHMRLQIEAMAYIHREHK
jgi:hypothetical protein